MSPRREEIYFAERFKKKLEKKLGDVITLPFEKELWQYRALVEKRKTRRLNRILSTMARYTLGQTKFPYPTKAEMFLKESNDSDSSYGRDESVLSEGYYIDDKIYSSTPGVKIYLCQKAIFSKNEKPDKVVVKVINLKKTLDEYIYNNLKKELDVILQVKHPFIIETYCVLYRRKEYFIFMRYAERSDLFSYLVNYGGVKEDEARVWAAQLGSALSFLHSQDITHLDVCCENILLTEHFNLKLTDFENSERIQYEMGRAKPLDEFSGSLEYASPEILQGRPYSGTGADTWAMIVVVHCMLTAHLPFQGQTHDELLKSQKGWKIKDSNLYTNNLNALFNKAFLFKSSRRYNLQRIMGSEWFKNDPRLTDWGEVEKRSRPEKEDVRPVDDPARRRLTEDPAQERTAAEVVRFQPFRRRKPSCSSLIPYIYREEDLGPTMSDDQSFGIPFTPGDEQQRHLKNIEKLWKSNLRQRKKPKGTVTSKKKDNDFAKLLYKAYKTVKHQDLE